MKTQKTLDGPDSVVFLLIGKFGYSLLFRLLILRFFDLLVMFLSHLFLALVLIFFAAFVSHCSLLSYCQSLPAVHGVVAL